MDEKFLNDIKNFEHLRSAGISEGIIQEAKAHSEKYPLFARMQSENEGIVFIEDEVSPFDWEALKLQLETKGMKFSIIQAEMPIEPPTQMTSSVTNGMYPRFDKLIKKE